MSIDINELTLGQAKEVTKLLGSQFTGQGSSSSLTKRYIGKYVIIRSRVEGINCGVVVDADHTGVILKDARRLHYHAPKDKRQSWYEGVANTGLSESSRISPTVEEEKAIVEDYSITVCTPKAEEILRNHPSHEQS